MQKAIIIIIKLKYTRLKILQTYTIILIILIIKKIYIVIQAAQLLIHAQLLILLTLQLIKHNVK